MTDASSRTDDPGRRVTGLGGIDGSLIGTRPLPSLWPLTARAVRRGVAGQRAQLRDVFDRLARHGRVLVVADQPATIGALPMAVARAAGHEVADLPGLAMRRIADLYPVNAKTDARDAYVIGDTARTLPHALRRVDVGDDTLAELDVLVGYDDDLAAEATRSRTGSMACSPASTRPSSGSSDPR